MKKWLHESEDWRTDTSDPMINAFRDVMASNLDHQDDPYVGIFWYDVNEEELFGTVLAELESCPAYQSKLFNKPVRTCRTLHQSAWKKPHYKGKDARYKGEYTLTPRGRVFYIEDEGFVVVTGSWIDNHPEAKFEIISEFNLPAETNFVKDVHWDIGHGDSANFL